jgi:hypothetical protein
MDVSPNAFAAFRMHSSMCGYSVGRSNGDNEYALRVKPCFDLTPSRQSIVYFRNSYNPVASSSAITPSLYTVFTIFDLDNLVDMVDDDMEVGCSSSPLC